MTQQDSHISWHSKESGFQLSAAPYVAGGHIQLPEDTYFTEFIASVRRKFSHRGGARLKQPVNHPYPPLEKPPVADPPFFS
ncbi:hypothetical protein [Thiolapillus sp.]|uniref:hypothetical protein n=1 Tax=Thiolapillus sp. TaxID=2017437 RepID=UPI003AF7EB1E